MTEIRPVTTRSWTLYGANSALFDQGAANAVPWEPACILTPDFLAFANVGAANSPVGSCTLGAEPHFNPWKRDALTEAKGRGRMVADGSTRRTPRFGSLEGPKLGSLHKRGDGGTRRGTRRAPLSPLAAINTLITAAPAAPARGVATAGRGVAPPAPAAATPRPRPVPHLAAERPAPASLRSAPPRPAPPGPAVPERRLPAALPLCGQQLRRSHLPAAGRAGSRRPPPSCPWLNRGEPAPRSPSLPPRHPPSWWSSAASPPPSFVPSLPPFLLPSHRAAAAPPPLPAGAADLPPSAGRRRRRLALPWAAPRRSSAERGARSHAGLEEEHPHLPASRAGERWALSTGAAAAARGGGRVAAAPPGSAPPPALAPSPGHGGSRPAGEGRAALRLPSCSAAAAGAGGVRGGGWRPAPGAGPGRAGGTAGRAPPPPRRQQLTFLRGAAGRAPPGRAPRAGGAWAEAGGELRSDLVKLPCVGLCPRGATRGGGGWAWTRPDLSRPLPAGRWHGGAANVRSGSGRGLAPSSTRRSCPAVGLGVASGP